jgi:hypothetical protein
VSVAGAPYIQVQLQPLPTPWRDPMKNENKKAKKLGVKTVVQVSGGLRARTSVRAGGNIKTIEK